MIYTSVSCFYVFSIATPFHGFSFLRHKVPFAIDALSDFGNLKADIFVVVFRDQRGCILAIHGSEAYSLKNLCDA